MVRAGAHLAAGAIAAALLLTGAGGAVAVADTPADSAVSKNANGTAPDSSAAAAEHSVDNNTFSSSENARSAGEQADNAVASNGSDAKDPPRVGSGDEQINEKKPDEKKPDHDPGTSDRPGDKTINKVRNVPKRRLPSTWPRNVPKRRLPSTWPRCPKRRLASTWPRCPKRRLPSTLPRCPKRRLASTLPRCPKRRLASTWPRCPKRRLASTWPRCPSSCPRNATAGRSTPHHLRPRPSTPTRWMRLPAKPDNVPAGMSHRS